MNKDQVECEGLRGLNNAGKLQEEMSLLPMNFFEQYSYTPICSTQKARTHLLSALERKMMMSIFTTSLSAQEYRMPMMAHSTKKKKTRQNSHFFTPIFRIRTPFVL